jgi:hypothetical protein
MIAIKSFFMLFTWYAQQKINRNKLPESLINLSFDSIITQ